MSNKDKERFPIICKDCGCEFLMTYGRIRRLPSDYHYRCPKCTNIRRSKLYDNLTEEERQRINKLKSEGAKRQWQNLSLDEYLRKCESSRARWIGKTKEEKAEMMKKTREASNKYNRLPETRAKLSQRNKDKWNSMSNEERALEIIRLNKIRDDNWKSMTDEEKFKKMLKMWKANVTTIGPTEFIFNNFLKSLGIVNGIDYMWSYNTYPYINSEYFNIFGKINPITGEENIPYHSWDFILFPSDKNPILIDIDGSAHNPSSMLFKRGNNNYTEREKIDYNDSQRLYQIPDGFIALIIQCYEDVLHKLTPVTVINNKNKFRYQDLQTYIKYVHKKGRQNLIDYRNTSNIDKILIDIEEK